MARRKTPAWMQNPELQKVIIQRLSEGETASEIARSMGFRQPSDEQAIYRMGRSAMGQSFSSVSGDELESGLSNIPSNVLMSGLPASPSLKADSPGGMPSFAPFIPPDVIGRGQALLAAGRSPQEIALLFGQYRVTPDIVSSWASSVAPSAPVSGWGTWQHEGTANPTPFSNLGTWNQLGNSPASTSFGGGAGTDVQLSSVNDGLKQLSEVLPKLVDSSKQLVDTQIKLAKTQETAQSDSSFAQAGSRNLPSPTGSQSFIRPLIGGSSPAFDANAWMGGDLGPPLPPPPADGVPNPDDGGYWGRRPRSIAAPPLAFGRSTAMQQGGSLLSQMYPEAEQSEGWGSRIGSAISNISIDPQKLSGALWRSSLLSTFLIAPQMRAMGDYQESYMQQQQQQLQTGGVSYSDLMQGTYGQMQRGQAMRSQAYYGFGEQVYSAYGGVFNSMTGPSGNAAGAAFGVLGPAAGLGAVAGGFGAAVGIPGLGLPIAAGAAAIGAAGYIDSASQNWANIGSFRNESAGQNIFEMAGTAFRNPSGYIGALTRGFQYKLGGMSDEEASKYKNSSLLDDLAQQYSRGEITQSDIERMLTPNNQSGVQAIQPGMTQQSLLQTKVNLGEIDFNVGQVVSRGRGLQLDNAASRLGITREAAQQNQDFFSRYSTGNPNDQQMLQLSSLLTSVNDPDALVNSLAGARGINPFNREGMSGLLNDVLGAGYNDITASAKTYSANMVRPVNTMRLMAGMGRFGEDYYSATADPDLNLARQQLDMGEAGMRRADPRIFDSLINYRGQVGMASALGDFPRAGQMQDLMGTAMGVSRRYMNYGNDLGAVSGLMNNVSGLSIDQQNQMYSAMSGDPYAIGALGRATGNQAMMQVDPEWQRQYQFNFQQLQRNIGFTTQTGFAPGTARLDSQGRAVGGDLSYLSGAFQSAGLSFDPGNGMGGWQVQDALTSINRQQQAYNLNQQGRYQDIQQRQFDLTGRQFYEQWNLNSNYLDANTTYNRTNMNINRQQQVERTRWGGEDLEFQRNQFDIQAGWRMEDFDRNIRYSRGRERLDMIRERDRAVISQSMQSGQMDKQESRFEQQKQWDTERFEREKQHFEMSAKYQRDNMDMQKRHFEESRQFQKEQLEMQREAHDKQISWMNESFALQDQQRLLERQNQILAKQQADEYATVMTTTQSTINNIKTSVDLLSDAAVYLRQRVDELPHTAGGVVGGLGSDVSNILNNILAQVTKSANTPAQVNAQIQVSPNVQSVPVKSITDRAYTSTRNSR